jgi:glycosyltransferase involved in cell wall biosynthesis
LKILHIGKYFPPFSGGLENYMRDAMVALGRRGVRSTALVHKHSFSLKTSDETFTVDGSDFHIVRTGMWARLLYTPISPTFPWHLRRLIKAFKPDILHLHLPNPSVFWVLALPSARSVPWVVHWHSDVITSAQDWRMKLFYMLYQPFEHAVLKRAKTIVATSSPYRDSSQPLKKWHSKCTVVPLGVDVQRFTCGGGFERDFERDFEKDFEKDCGRGVSPRFSNPAPSQDINQNNRGETPLPQPLPQSLLQVLAVGRLTYYKGFRYLIEAAAQTPDIHVNLVGDGDQAENLRALTASLNLQDRVTFHGILSDDELAQKMVDCDCLCLPSIERTEAFGMVLLEAMYFGKATVVSDVEGSGMGWIVDDGITGIKVKPANANALADAFKRLAADREELDNMGKRGREKFDQHFEINHAIEDLIEIYQQTLNR